MELVAGWVVRAPDLLYLQERWGDTLALCVPAGADGAASVTAALAEEADAAEPSTVALVDTGGSTTQMILAAFAAAGVACRVLLVGMASEVDAWYGRPCAAAIWRGCCE